MSEREAAIQRYMKSLDLTREEAEQLWEDDQEDIETPEMRAMAENAKKNGLLKPGAREIVEPNGKRKPRKPREPDQEKREIIESLQSAMDDWVGEWDGLTEPQIKNPEREITFTLNGNEYSLTLTKHRPPKK